jgi:hypothetical protein
VKILPKANSFQSNPKLQGVLQKGSDEFLAYIKN